MVQNDCVVSRECVQLEEVGFKGGFGVCLASSGVVSFGLWHC